MADNFAQFRDGVLRATTTDVRETFLRLLRGAFKHAAVNLVRGTPVDTGRARGNYNTTEGRPSGDYDETRRDPEGLRSIGEAISFVEGITNPNVAIWITNNAPYIGKLEDGSSQQAPQGMLSLAVEDLLALLRSANSVDDIDTGVF